MVNTPSVSSVCLSRRIKVTFKEVFPSISEAESYVLVVLYFKCFAAKPQIYVYKLQIVGVFPKDINFFFFFWGGEAEDLTCNWLSKTS